MFILGYIFDVCQATLGLPAAKAGIQRVRPAEIPVHQEDLMTAIYVYWISTALLSLLYLASGSMYSAKTT